MLFNEIKKSKPEVIVMIGAYKTNSLFIKKGKNDEILKNVIFFAIYLLEMQTLL